MFYFSFIALVRRAAIKQKRELVLFYFYFSLLQLCGPLNGQKYKQELTMYWKVEILYNAISFHAQDHSQRSRSNISTFIHLKRAN